MEANLDVLAAPPISPIPKPGGSPYSLTLRILLVVHLVLVPVMVLGYLIWSIFAVSLGEHYDPLRLAVATGVMSGLFALDVLFKLTALIALGRAPQRVTWYLISSAVVTVGYLMVIFLGFRSMEQFAAVPLLVGGVLVAEFIVYGKVRRASPSSPGPQTRTRADLVVGASGALLAGLLAAWVGVSQYAWYPEYRFDDGVGLVDDALAEVLAGMESPPAISDGIAEAAPESQCDEVFFSEFVERSSFESGSFEDYEDEIRGVWAELGYEVDESVTEKDGLPHLEATRSDGVHMALTMGDRPSSEGKVVLAAYSGCVLS
jgi:hypothetical protein